MYVKCKYKINKETLKRTNIVISTKYFFIYKNTCKKEYKKNKNTSAFFVFKNKR